MNFYIRIYFIINSSQMFEYNTSHNVRAWYRRKAAVAYRIRRAAKRVNNNSETSIVARVLVEYSNRDVDTSNTTDHNNSNMERYAACRNVLSNGVVTASGYSNKYTKGKLVEIIYKWFRELFGTKAAYTMTQYYGYDTILRAILTDEVVHMCSNCVGKLYHPFHYIHNLPYMLFLRMDEIKCEKRREVYEKGVYKYTLQFCRDKQRRRRNRRFKQLRC
jgi:hypothetical protein